MSQPRSNAIIPLTPAADHSGKEGYAVKIVAQEAALCSDNTDAVFGVIVDGADTDGKDSVAVVAGGLAGTVRVKLSDSPGTVVLGTRLEIVAGGAWKADAGTSGTVAAVALEAGSAGELIEAVVLEQEGTITLEQSWHTDVGSDYADPNLAVTGQVKDAAGNALAGTFVVGLFFGAAAGDGTPVDLGTLTALSGSALVKELTDDALALVQTDTDGSWGVQLALVSSDTVHSNAYVVGQVAADDSGALVVS